MNDKLTERLIFYGVVAFVLYLIYQKVSNALGPASAPATAGGGFLQKLLNPAQANYQPGQSWAVVFPDGAKHAIDPSTINPADNSFVWSGDGQTYIMATGVTGTHAAYPASSIVNPPPNPADPTAPNFGAPGVAGVGAYRMVRRRAR
jgi:hypothetical protein